MKPMSNYHAPKTVPAIYHEFFEYLKDNYPTSTLSCLHLEVSRRSYVAKRSDVKWVMGNTRTWEMNGKLCVSMKVATGSPRVPRAVDEVFRYIAHEYKHALQLDQSQEIDCAEADSFAAYVIPHFNEDRSLRKAA